MSFESISLVLSWMELGTLLAILFRLSGIFGLIANTQRELRRAIHNLGARRITELGTGNAFERAGSVLGSCSLCARVSAESTLSPDALTRRASLGEEDRALR
jgi:hypothetical protein